MPSNHLILCHLLFLLPSIFPSIRVFSNELAFGIRWPKYWSFSFNISPSNEYSGLISLGLSGLISLQSKGLSRVFSNTTVQKYSSLVLSLLSGPTLTSVHDYWENNSYIKFKGPSIKLPKPQLACILGLSLSPVLSPFSSGPVYSICHTLMCETGVLHVHQDSPPSPFFYL